MQGWQHGQIISALKQSVEQGRICVGGSDLERWSEKNLVECIEIFSQLGTSLEQDIIEFLINARRFNFGYRKNGEVWSILEQHLNQDFSKSTSIDGPFGLIVEISGHRTGNGFKISVTTKDDVSSDTNNYQRVFQNIFNDFPEKEVAHIIYMDEEKTAVYGFPFMLIMNQFYVAESNIEELSELSQTMKRFFLLPKDLESDTQEISNFRKEATNLFLSSDVKILDLAFNSICDDIEDKFSHDLVRFFSNVIVGNEFVKKSIDSLEPQISNESHCAILMNYASTRRGEPPSNMLLTPEIVSNVISELEKEGDDPSRWIVNREILSKIPPSQIGIMHCDDEMSDSHKFPFDVTVTIDRK